MPANTTGQWDSLLSWPVIGIHSIITQDGKVMTFGTNTSGAQGATMYHDVWDPVTNTHQLLDHHLHTPTDIFCAAAIILPGTDQILIAGGDARPLGHVNTGVDDVNFFNNTTLEIKPAADGEMNVARWYPTTISLPTGQVVIIGGTNMDGVGMGTPEIYTPGEGWRLLKGAADTEVASSALYPRTFLAPNGKVYYMVMGASANGRYEIKELDLAGDGAVREVATLPFSTAWDSPAIMYQPGKILIADAGTGLWTVDLTGTTPVSTRVATLPAERNWSNMTVLADGKVVINGGSPVSNTAPNAELTATVWNPQTNTLTDMVDEAKMRLYHSSALLLPDGSLLSVGGGAPGPETQLNGQIYKPTYLFDSSGNPAVRPVISYAPPTAKPGASINITVDNAAAIQKLTIVKPGTATHALNMDASFIQLSYTVVNSTTLKVQLPSNINDLSAGTWMLFAWNGAGTPSVASMIAITPTQASYDGIGDLTASYVAVPAGTSSLDQINFGATKIHQERVASINETAANFYPGGPADNFAVQYLGNFQVARAGSYTFYLTSDDGSRLYIDGKLVIDNNALQAATEKSAAVTLTAGVHRIEVRYFESTGGNSLDLDWSGPGLSRSQMTFDAAEKNLLANGSLELFGVGAGSKFVASLPGWTTTGQFEVWGDGAGGYNAPSGNVHLMVDGQTGSISNTFKTVRGDTYELSFDVAGHTGAIASSRIEVLRNGVVIATISPADTNWDRKVFSFTGNGGTETIQFRSVAGDTDAVGAHLDGVVVTRTGGPAINYGTITNDMPNTVQYLTGGTSTIETFAIDGNAADYGWGPTQDGLGIVVWGETGYDIFFNFDYIKFNDRTVPLQNTGNVYQDIPDVVQNLTGNSNNDTFVIDGARANYGFGPTGDGAGIVVWNTTSYDLLFGFEKIQFDDQTVDISTPTSGRTVSDIVGQVQHERGTQFVDTFIINGNSADYGWSKTGDGLNHVVWTRNGPYYDVLYSWERIQFNDLTVDLLTV